MEAGAIFVLFSTQLMFTDPQFRFYYSVFYLVLAFGLVLCKRDARNGIRALFSHASAMPAIEKH
jgi:hypothetical protein